MHFLCNFYLQESQKGFKNEKNLADILMVKFKMYFSVEHLQDILHVDENYLSMNEFEIKTLFLLFVVVYYLLLFVDLLEWELSS